LTDFTYLYRDIHYCFYCIADTNSHVWWYHYSHWYPLSLIYCINKNKLSSCCFSRYFYDNYLLT